MEGVFKTVEEEPHVTEVASPYGGGEGAAAISDDGKIAYATIQYDVQGNEAQQGEHRKDHQDRAGRHAAAALDVQLGGQPIEEAKEESGDSSFAIGLLAAILILLLAFGSVVAMGLPIITALLALGVGLSLVTLGTWIFDTAEFAPVLALMIGLGVGIDYALFIVTRFRNNLDEGFEPREAAINAVDTAGRAVLFAGTTVIIALMGMFLLNITFLYGVAVAAALSVLFTMIAALTLLPALLTWVGHRVNKWKIPGLSAGRNTMREDTKWYAWSRWIQKRPWTRRDRLRRRPAASSACPTLSLRLGVNDAGTNPKGQTTREAYDLLAEGFGPGFNGPLTMVAKLPASGKTEGDRTTLCTTLKSEEGIASVTAVSFNKQKTVGLCQVYPTTSPQSADTTDTAESHPQRRDPADRSEDRCGPPRRRHHRGLRGLRRRDLGKAAALHRRGDPALGAPADGGLPLGAGAAEGDRDEPAVDRRRLRHRRRGVPERLGGEHHRGRRHRPDHRLLPDLPVLDRLRALDGLRGVPDVPHPRGVGARQGRRRKR